MKYNNYLYDILDILERSDEEKVDIVKIFDQLSRNKILISIEKQTSSDFVEEINNSKSIDEKVKLIKEKIEDKDIQERILDDLFSFFEEFIVVLVKESDKSKKGEVLDYLKKAREGLK